MEKIIQIPEWKMKQIEDTLRLANNIHHSQSKETCFDRQVCKAWDYAKEALSNNNNPKKQLVDYTNWLLDRGRLNVTTQLPPFENLS